MDRREKRPVEKEKVCETFETEGKDGKIEYKTLCGAIEQSHASREEVKRHKKILKWVLFAIGVIILMLIIWMTVSYFKSHFQYRGITGDVVQEGQITFYRTKFPTMYKGVLTDYNFYIRNDPRELDKEIPFTGEMVLKPKMAIESEGFTCNGDGVIAVANMVQFFSFVGTEIVKDPSAQCDAQGRYGLISLRSSKDGKTSVEQFGPACYYINIANCEVLKGTERFMTEAFVYVNDNVLKKG